LNGHGETSFLSLLIVILLAAAVPMITTQMKRIRIPIVVGEITAGIIVGKSGLNLVSDDPWLALLSTLGFSYLMFLSGLEIDFSALIGRRGQPLPNGRSRLRSPTTLAFISFLFTLAAALVLSTGLYKADLVRDPILMALILSTTSLGIVVPTLKERRELRTRYGQTLLVAALLADFATMLLISIYVIFHTNGLTPEMLAVLILLGAFFTVYRIILIAQRHSPLEEAYRRVSSAVSHLQARGAFAMGLAFIALAEQLGVEVILGAFLGGALIALLSNGDEGESSLREQLDVMGYGFFIPIFFIMVGVQFDLRALLSSSQTMLLAPLLIAMAYAIKLIPSLIFRLTYGWRQTLGAGLLLSSRLSLIIAAAAIGLDLGAIDPAVNSAIILLAIVTCTISPSLFNRIVPPQPPPREQQIVVVGGNREALLLVKRLAEADDPVILALPPGTSPPDQVPQGVTTASLNEISPAALRAIGAHQAKTLVALLEDDAANLRLCQIAKTTFGIRNVVARVLDSANVEAYAAIGAHPVTTTDSEVTVLENLASHPNVFTLLAEGKAGQEVVEVEMTNPALDGVPLHMLRLPGHALIMVIQRGGRLIVPWRETRLALHDVVSVLASPDEADEIQAMFTRHTA